MDRTRRKQEISSFRRKVRSSLNRRDQAKQQGKISKRGDDGSDEYKYNDLMMGLISDGMFN